MTAALPQVQSSEAETRMERIRDRLERTTPAERGLRVLLVLAHEALRQEARAAAAIAGAGLGPAPAEAGEQPEVEAADYEELIARIVEIGNRVIPANAQTLILSKGDDALLACAGDAAHFPQGPKGVYAGHYPADGGAAVAHLENCVASGFEFLVIPATAYWWLEYYGEFAQTLLATSRVAHHDEHCLIFDLRSRPERRFER